jgi:deoxyribodipyrimidine photo-lyase
MTSLVWLRQDLRVRDHPALCAAAAEGAVVPVYILDDGAAGDKHLGGAQHWWLHHSLTALGAELSRLGAPLILRRGNAPDVLRALMHESGATRVHAIRHYEPWWQRAENELAADVDLVLHEGNHLANPRSILSGSGDRYRVFTPWWNKLQSLMPPEPPLAAPEHLTPADPQAASDDLASWGLLPKLNWADGFSDWTPGEEGARAALRAFLPILDGYDTERNFPARAGVSRLSPHLHFGEISPRTIWRQAIKQAGAGAKSFLSEIGWREHGTNLIDQFPNYAEQSGRRLFDTFPWRSGVDADRDFKAWTSGQTGVPVIDAGMRQLWQTGWMHNRVRMITASFLVKHLLIDWRRGERWFWDTLLDADLGSNAMNWQYVSGAGVDAPVFSRIMAPYVQSPKFEMADYIRKWVPELAHLRDSEIHAPHEAGVTPPNYPLPIVGHEAARARALAAWEAARADALSA